MKSETAANSRRVRGEDLKTVRRNYSLDRKAR